MSLAETATSSGRWLPSIDTSWQNIVFSLRTAAAAILALAFAYWLELSEPQWATLTVYILAQPTVGAALAKGAWRAVGTVAGGLSGLVLVALFSQAAELLVAATVLLVGASFYAGARLRNYTSYGVLLAGYTMLLVAYEGSADPLHAWSIAIDRTTAILIGIACATLASTIILPRYAGDVLREAQANTFVSLANYVATALRLSAPATVFMQLRRQMVTEVASFDALCSFTLFETPELRANAEYLRRTVREFLVVLSIARSVRSPRRIRQGWRAAGAGPLALDIGDNRGADRAYRGRPGWLERCAQIATRDFGRAGRIEEHRNGDRRPGRRGAVRSAGRCAVDRRTCPRSAAGARHGRRYPGSEPSQQPRAAGRPA